MTPPPPPLFLQDYDDKTSVSCRELENEQQQDPVDEYIRLSVKAVKIKFPDVTVSNHVLIEKAKMVPFYRVHDGLSSYMRKLEYKQSFPKEREMQQSLCDGPSPSIFEKMQGFFGCGVMLEYSQKKQCGVIKQVWDENRKKYGRRLGFRIGYN